MTDDTTARLELPLLQAGQAQKELTHNEALARLDLAVQAVVTAVGVNAPPATPSLGSCWIVGSMPTGAWTGHAQAIAGWTSGGWRFVAAYDGLAAWSLADALTVRFAAGAWTVGALAAAHLNVGGVQVVGGRQPAVAAPAGGSVVDAEARAAVAGMLAALRAHGLIAG